MSVDWQLPTTLPPVDLIPSADFWECLHLHVHTHIHMQNKKLLKSQYLSPVDQKSTNSYLGYCLIETELPLLSQCHVCTSGRFICLPFYVAQVVNITDNITHENFSVWSSVITCPFQTLPVSLLWEYSWWYCAQRNERNNPFGSTYCIDHSCTGPWLCHGIHRRLHVLGHWQYSEPFLASHKFVNVCLILTSYRLGHESKKRSSFWE